MYEEIITLYAVYHSVFFPVYSQTCEPPRASSISLCTGSSAVLVATGGSGEYRWYDAISEGSLLSTGSEFRTPVLTSTSNYYVEVINDNCISPRTPSAITQQRTPLLTGVNDQVYKLMVTDSRGCVTEDEIFIDVLMPIVLRNTFTPNGDGVNDVWTIPELNTYPDNTVLVVNRYGVKIFSSVGYEYPWDGTHNGLPAPVGTYYYIINTKFPGLLYSGNVTILR